MKEKRSVDLTEGSIAKNIIRFSMPIMLGQVFQNLYNSVDSIVVGNFVGVSALAAVSSSVDISQMIIGFFTGLSVGSGVVFSRYFGAKNYQKLHDSIHTAIAFSIVLGLGMLIIGEILTPALLHMVDCPEEVYAEALIYLRVYLIGVLFTSIYNVASGVLRSVGDSRSPFIYLILSSATNIVLDIFFVISLHMGVTGVAIATIISQLESVIFVLFRMIRTSDVYHLDVRELRIEKTFIGEIMNLGLPAGIQSCLIAFSNLFVQKYVNSFGMEVLAGTGIAKKVDKYAGLISQSLGQATTIYVSQCVGAEKHERAFKGIRTVLLINLIAIIAITIPLYIYAPQVSRIFTSDEETIYYSTMMIRTLMPLYYLQSLHQVFSNAVRGFGKSMAALFTTIGGLIVCRQAYMAIALSWRHEVELVFIGWPVGWFFSALFAILYYLFKIRFPYNREKKAEAEISGAQD
jgi:putative MATE family efflux protein